MAKLIEITGKALSGEWGLDDETGTGIPVLRTTNFTNEGIVNYDNVVTRVITKKNISEKFLQKGDIILEKSGGSDKQPVGRVIYFDGPEQTYLFNNFTGLLRVKDKAKWNPKFVFYALFGNYRQGGTKAFENKTTGLHNLKTDDYVSRFEIKDIPLDNQETICCTLEKIQGIISARKAQLLELDNLVKARFVEMFGDPINNPKDWKVKLLSEVCTKITDGEHQNPVFVESGIPMIMANNVREGVTKEGCRYITEQDYQKFSKKCAPEFGDILLVSRGATIGRCCENNLDEPFSLMGSVILIKNKKDIIESKFLLNWLRNKKINQLIYTTSSASAQQAIYMKDLAQTRIVVPPMDMQQSFAAFVTQVDKSKVIVQKALDKAQTLFDSLMQEYFG